MGSLTKTSFVVKLGIMMAISFFLFLGLSLAQVEPSALSPSASVFVVEVDEEIRSGTAQYVARALRRAEMAEADLFVLELNTPGGLLKATEEISRSLIDSPVPTAVYVHKPSGWAFSAGVFILLSGDISASVSTASLGAAEPVGLGGEAVGDKTKEAAGSWLRSLAERNNRDPGLAERFVTENLTLSGSQAHELGVVDELADSLPELLTTLGVTEPSLNRLAPNLVDHLLSFLSLPYLIPIFLSLGGLGLFLVFRTGEFDSIGLAGVVFLLIGLWGMGAVQLSVVGAVLLIFGLTLIAVQLLAPPADFGISGIIGLGSLLGGILLFANEPFFPSYLTTALFYAVLGVGITAGAAFVVLGHLSVTAMRGRLKSGMEKHVGEIIEVTEDIAPVGAVTLEAERYPARLEGGGEVSAGNLVRVVKVVGNTILVEILSDPKQSARLANEPDYQSDK